MATQFRQNPTVETSPLQEELILFHSQTGKFCVLNRTSASIWTHLQQPKSVEEIAEELARSFDGVTIGDAVRDVTHAIDEMVSLGLVVPK